MSSWKTGFLVWRRIAPEQRVALPGITPERTMQIVGGGVVADEIMKALNIQVSRDLPVGAA